HRRFVTESAQCEHLPVTPEQHTEDVHADPVGRLPPPGASPASGTSRAASSARTRSVLRHVRATSLTDPPEPAATTGGTSASEPIGHAERMLLTRPHRHRGLRLRIRVALLFTLAALLVTI